MNAPGVRLIGRPSYEYTASVMGSPFDYPLSSRFDENDMVLVFDKVLIPWENVLIYRDIDRANNFFPISSFINRALLHGITRFAVKLDFVAGLLLKALRAAGTDQFRGVQVNLGEVIALRNLFWGLSDAMALNPMEGSNGTVLPNLEYGMAYRVFAPVAWPRVKDIVENIVAGSLIVQPSSVEDFKDDETRELLDRFYRGSHGVDAESKIKVIKLLWDAIGTEYAGRHELYERNYAGNHENNRLENLIAARASGRADEFESFVEQCLSDYDLDGWTTPTWINPTDVSRVLKR